LRALACILARQLYSANSIFAAVRMLTVGNMYPPDHYGGYELMWRSAVRHLRRGGHEVRVLTTDYQLPDAEDPEEDPDVHRELRWYWRDHEFPPIGAFARLRLERHNARVLDRHLRRFALNVVNWWAMGGMSSATGPSSCTIKVTSWVQAATAHNSRFLPAQEVILRPRSDRTRLPQRWIEAKGSGS
jgi:glycosyltransferase involved in cell wall biosynthesis